MTEKNHRVALRDVIDAHIDVTASLEQVWDVVSVPGWWIVDCAEDEMRRLRQERGASVRVSDAFQVEGTGSDEPHQVSFRWIWTQDPDRPVTTVTFRLEPATSGTVLHVQESGLSVGGPDELLATHYTENREGWDEQLRLAKRTAEGDQAR